MDVVIQLPQSVQGLKVSPEQDLVSNQANQKLRFRRAELAPKEGFQLRVTFAKILEVSLPQGPNLLWPSLIGLGLGLVVALLDIVKGEKDAKKSPGAGASGKSTISLSMTELGWLTRGESGGRQGVSADIFRLAQAGNLRLHCQVKQEVLGGRKAEVTVEVLCDQGLSELEGLILDKVRGHRTLQKLAQDYRAFSEITAAAKESLVAKGFVSQEKMAQQAGTYLTSVPFFLLGVGGTIYGGVNLSPIALGSGFVFLCAGVGRLIRGAATVILTDQGQWAKEQFTATVEATKKGLEEHLRVSPREGLKTLFADLPYIIMHPKFSRWMIDGYKRQLQGLTRIELPHWLIMEAEGIDALDALKPLEVLDYTLLVVLTAGMHSSSGTGMPGAGGGGAAGGGGGGAS